MKINAMKDYRLENVQAITVNNRSLKETDIHTFPRKLAPSSEHVTSPINHPMRYSFFLFKLLQMITRIGCLSSKKTPSL
jgi:hypothetical protein